MDKALNLIIFDGSFETTAFIRRLMNGLVKRGHHVTIIGFNEYNPNPVAGVHYQSLGSNQSKLKLINTSLIMPLKQGSWGLVFKVLRLILKGERKQLQEHNLKLALKIIKPDIVHVQWPSLLPWIEPCLKNKDFKTVLSQRGFHINVRPFVNSENFKYLQNIYPHLDGLHSVSKAISTLSKNIGLPHTRIDQVVYTGLNLEVLPYNTKSSKNIPLQLLSVGRSHWIKDYPTSLRACTLLKAKAISFHYTIIGGAGDEELLYLIHELDLDKHVTLIGKLAQNQVFTHMKGADILLLPSIEEGLPNVAVEAMALGTPVISAYCGGIDELITDGVTGWLVPVGNPEALADTILKVDQLDLDSINKVAKTARLKVETQHSDSKMVVGMEKLYRTVMTT